MELICLGLNLSVCQVFNTTQTFVIIITTKDAEVFQKFVNNVDYNLERFSDELGTECRGQVVDTPAFYSGGYEFKISA